MIPNKLSKKLFIGFKYRTLNFFSVVSKIITQNFNFKKPVTGMVFRKPRKKVNEKKWVIIIQQNLNQAYT